CDRGSPERLIFRNNEISKKGKHKREANRLASQRNLYYNQIFRDFLLTRQDKFVNTLIASNRKIKFIQLSKNSEL
ncbi:hypothetical protein HZS_585, partial [Henneguya salminicola]